jgi:hypothetical protein
MITKYKNLGITLSQKEMKEIKGGAAKPPPNGRQYICPHYTTPCVKDTDVDCFLDCPSVSCFTNLNCV